ncbi:MAG: hypothetical protein QHH07_11260 [Sedimentisphaerales bacterium]|jgi:hypothetical protein|nr:hypothetical protein [Sedimentisphaerales bacterium]
MRGSRRSGLHKPITAIFTKAVMPEEVRPGNVTMPSGDVVAEVQPKVSVKAHDRPKARSRQRQPKRPAERPVRPQVQLPLLGPLEDEARPSGLGRAIRAFVDWVRGRQG